ncbi:MAG: transcriptional repressor LexA [Paracoccaceae bacterium]|jgi:repressor LexA|nr:transcriptional repressor LexA [Paracoccaceae bacterium]|tara:strand:+ start:581 stop:1267 length:687 start_codon:yes stop_codon:yes gene_type:complete
MLTKKQLELLNFINNEVGANGISPSFDEMKIALNLKSKSGIHRLITALEERGFIRKLAHKARALEIIKLPEIKEKDSSGLKLVKQEVKSSNDLNIIEFKSKSTDLPVMGKIAAGTPIEAINQVSHHISVPSEMITNHNNHYALEIKGDSMIEAGINDGDIVVIKEQSSANNGDIVVALIEGHEATLKRFRRHGRSIALEPANSAYETRVIPDNLIEIQGRLVGLIRSY